MTEPLTQQGSIDDWLGYSAYADALWARTVRALDKDKGGKPLGDDPLVIGIFGEWGAGKSHLLKLVQARAEDALKQQIAAREGDPGFSLTVPVWFQPWKYEHEEHLHVPMVIHVLNALKDALKRDPTVVQTLVGTGGKAVAVVDTVVPVLAKGAKVAKSIFPIAQKILKSISFFGVSIDLPDDLEDWLEAAADAGASEEKDKPAVDVKKSAVDHAPKHVANGSYFYRIHELLDALTRPDTCKERKSLFDHAELTLNTRINFVIFIDDLDRCLPEKAVQTLELIKTIFNAESFAFVLALDEEVIERGIGHRYQAYNFAGKKPEMPITGFEYLEKIVHLPFRLPTVTESQARRFVEKLEEQIAPRGPHWFKLLADQQPHHHYIKRNSTSRFSMPELVKAIEKDGSLVVPEGSWTEPNPQTFDLLALALGGFDAYVPRKLSRLVELWHATELVARIRHEADNRKEVLVAASVAQVDIRIVLTLLMVQIFHPDLYRVFRRHEETFQTLYNGFDSSGDNLSPSLSDIDLWHWAAYKFKEKDKEDVRPTHLDEALAMIARLDDGSRYPAQQKRLPLVECIIAHRKAQRHVFDALKLFSALKQQMPALPQGFKVAQYFSLLAEYDPMLTPPRVVPVPAPTNPEVTSDTIRRFTPVDAQQLYLSLIAADAGTQEALAEKAQLEVGKFLAKSALDNLIQRVKAWLGGAMGATDPKRGKLQLLNGLFYVAPFIADKEGESLWEIVKDSVDLQDEPNPKLRALWGDVRAKLGCDPRFKETGLRLAKNDIEDLPTAFTTKGDKLPGFAHIDARNKPFWFGESSEMSDKARQIPELNKPFHLARTLTTVDQYRAFLASNHYADYFQGLGAQWLEDAYEIPGEDSYWKKVMGERKTDQRLQPVNWSEQLKNPLHPVVNVSWFEAQAYIAWLQSELPVFGYGNWKASLPTELQWECAARYGSTDTEEPRPYPWTGEPRHATAYGSEFVQHANLSGLVGSLTIVGVYPRGHSHMGLADMAGNAWEWMADLCIEQPEPNQANADQKFDGSIVLRGGSFQGNSRYARCSSRIFFQAGGWQNTFGFRVVLSQPD